MAPEWSKTSVTHKVMWKDEKWVQGDGDEAPVAVVVRISSDGGAR